MGCSVNKSEYRCLSSNNQNAINKHISTKKEKDLNQLNRKTKDRNFTIYAPNNLSFNENSLFNSEESEFDCQSIKIETLHQCSQLIEGNGQSQSQNQNSKSNFSDLRNTNYFLCPGKENLKSISFKLEKNCKSAL